MEFSQEDLVIIRKALCAYQEHLTPSASYVKEIADWSNKVANVQHKLNKILLNSESLINRDNR